MIYISNNNQAQEYVYIKVRLYDGNYDLPWRWENGN